MYDDHGEGGLVWLPDSSGVVYWDAQGVAPSDLYAVSADGTGLRRLTTTPRDENDPAWSPDGTQLVFAQRDFVGHLCEGCPSTLWRANADASGRTRLTTSSRDGSFDSHPSWSPSGDVIAYEHTGFSSGQVRFLEFDGSPSPPPLKIGAPSWSPDGSTLAFYDEQGVEGIAPTGGPMRLLASIKNANDVNWSPDGHLLAITTNQGGLFVAPSDGSSPPARIASTGRGASEFLP